jgi:hypothetical protein
VTLKGKAGESVLISTIKVIVVKINTFKNCYWTRTPMTRERPVKQL